MLFPQISPSDMAKVKTSIDKLNHEEIQELSIGSSFRTGKITALSSSNVLLQVGTTALVDRTSLIVKNLSNIQVQLTSSTINSSVGYPLEPGSTVKLNFSTVSQSIYAKSVGFAAILEVTEL
jgi:hypothetical protein